MKSHDKCLVSAISVDINKDQESTDTCVMTTKKGNRMKGINSYSKMINT